MHLFYQCNKYCSQASLIYPPPSTNYTVYHFVFVASQLFTYLDERGGVSKVFQWIIFHVSLDPWTLKFGVFMLHDVFNSVIAVWREWLCLCVSFFFSFYLCKIYKKLSRFWCCHEIEVCSNDPLPPPKKKNPFKHTIKVCGRCLFLHTQIVGVYTHCIENLMQIFQSGTLPQRSINWGLTVDN